MFYRPKAINLPGPLAPTETAMINESGWEGKGVTVRR